MRSRASCPDGEHTGCANVRAVSSHAIYEPDGDSFVPTSWARGPWGQTISGHYVGGLLGVGIVLSLLVGVRAAGVLRTGLALVAGQLGGALLLDLVLPGGPGVRLPVLAGALLTLLAVVVTGLGRRGPDRVAAEGAREPDGRLVG